ncbi:MAG: chaperonin GroEL, partial [Candidatus Pacebacteria bacterium]|nr:chaperonin GroEL [Candidatus Paceibacterota bacterium]
VGYSMLIDALSAPLRQIVENAGKNLNIVHEVEKLGGNKGYDAKNDKIVDMLEDGIIDPLKVTRSGLQHAVSAASMLLTTEVAIAPEPQKEGEGGGAAMPGGMGGGMPGMGF